MDRRQFVRKSAGILAVAAGITAAMSYLRQFFPRRAGAKRRIILEEPRFYPVDTYTYLETHHLFIYRGIFEKKTFIYYSSTYSSSGILWTIQ